MKKVSFGKFEQRELTKEELEEIKKDEEYCKKFMPKGNEIRKVFKEEDEKLPRLFRYAPIGSNKYESGIIKQTEYGIKQDTMSQMIADGILSEQMIRNYSFDTYETKHSWQKVIKENAIKYVKEFDTKDIKNNKWFIITGLTGSGKSHIATSIVFGLAGRLIKPSYISWVSFKNEVKRNIKEDNSIETDRKMEYLKNTQLLYIDDFLKVGNDDNLPSNYDMELATDILWARYQNSLPTIISTEYDLELTISKVNKALAGRIVEMSKGYLNVLGDNETRNYRLYGSD